MKSFENAKKDDEKSQLHCEFREDGAYPLACLLLVGSKP
jgi:hypothetical protein